MADEIRGQRMSEYTPLSDLTQAEQETYLANAAVTTYGKTSDGGANTNVNVPLSAIKPDVPVTDVQVGGSSVVSNGVAIIQKYSADYPIMNTGYEFSLDYNHDQFTIAGDNNTELTLTNPVPPPGDNAHRGEFLTVNNSDEIVWGTAPAPSIKGSDTINYDTSHSGALSVKYNSDSLDSDGTNGLKVKLPVPPTASANEGDVLTIDSDGDIGWAPVSGGGGGGGNPYTKVSVTPGAPYPNTDGRSSYGWTYDDQDVVISNNTYSVLNTAVGNGNGTDVGETDCVDMLNIKLPEGTDFPMAVVEFVVSNNYGNGVNNIRVFVGSTALTRMYEAPYASNNLMTDSHKTLGYDTLDNDHKIIRGISDSNLSSYNNAYLGATKVQVHIFGNCFKVMVNKDTGEPAAS